jgi:hypothetical protein
MASYSPARQKGPDSMETERLNLIAATVADLRARQDALRRYL